MLSNTNLRLKELFDRANLEILLTRFAYLAGSFKLAKGLEQKGSCKLISNRSNICVQK